MAADPGMSTQGPALLRPTAVNAPSQARSGPDRQTTGAGGAKARTLADLQRLYGNRQLQRLLGRLGSVEAVLREVDRDGDDHLTAKRDDGNLHMSDPPEEDEEEAEGGRSTEVMRDDLPLAASDDPAEREAERVAATVDRLDDGDTLMHKNEDDDNILRGAGLATGKPVAARSSDRMVVRVTAGSGSNLNGQVALPSALAARIRRGSGGGETLRDGMRRQMEAKLGHDFSGVRVHTGREAQSICRSLDARAFSLGRDVWLSRDEDSADKTLLAHELTHVVQHGEAAVLNPRQIVDRADLSAGHVQRVKDAMWRATGDVKTYRARLFRLEQKFQGDAMSAALTRLVGPDAVTDHGLASASALRRCGGSGGSAPPTTTAPAVFPTITEQTAGSAVQTARDADWTASLSDFNERFGWITWDRAAGTFDVAGRSIGTWESCSPGPKPADAGGKYMTGHWHIHPQLPPAQAPRTLSFPVAPSGADRNFAAAHDSPGIVKDYTDTTRTTTTEYTYGPTRRSGAPT
jgi:hypothetical protein